MRAVLQAFEIFLALSAAWLLVFVLPFRLLARVLGSAAPDGDAEAKPRPAETATGRALSRRIDRFAPRFPGRTTCLVRAVAGWLLLARRGIPSVVRFGVRKADGALEAHAWLLIAGQTVIGGDGVQAFTPIADMGRQHVGQERVWWRR